MSASPTVSAKLVSEFVGTFLLVFTVGCNVLSKNAVWGGVSIGCVLMVSIYGLGGVSGANFNPAVSLALALVKKLGHVDGRGLSLGDMGMYMATQLTAGCTAAFAYKALFGASLKLDLESHPGGSGPADSFRLVQDGLCEFLYTFFLCFVVLNVAIAKGTQGNQFYGWAIGCVIIAGAYGAGATSGGCFNPAVSFAIDVSSFHHGIGWCFFYWACEFIGAIVAVGLFRVVRPEDFGAAASPAAAYVSEFLGTYMLVLTVGLNVIARSGAGALSIAASLMSMIYALGDVSGANFNPAVTVALLASGRVPDMTVAKASIYVLVQIVAGIAASFSYSFIRREKSFALEPLNGFHWTGVGAAEVVFTFVLVSTVLNVAVSTSTKAPTMFGFAIGACVIVGGNAVGSISGGCLNPAVSWGIAVSHLPSGVPVRDSLLAGLSFMAFQFVGAGLAVGVFKVTHAHEVASTVGFGSAAEGRVLSSLPEHQPLKGLP